MKNIFITLFPLIAFIKVIAQYQTAKEKAPLANMLLENYLPEYIE